MIGRETANEADPTEIARSPSFADRIEAAIGRARTQGLGIALVALIVLFAVRAPGFATMDNFGDALRDLSILGILAIGETFVIIGGGIDLSVGSVLLLAGIVSDDLIRLGEVHTAIAIPIALAIGCIAGAINGLLITRLRISAFIVTLASLYMFRGAGLSLYRTDVQNLQAAIISDENFLILGQNDIFGVPVSFIIFAVLLGVGTFGLRRTRFGLHLYALGGSELAARLTRIRVARIQLSKSVRRPRDTARNTARGCVHHCAGQRSDADWDPGQLSVVHPGDGDPDRGDAGFAQSAQYCRTPTSALGHYTQSAATRRAGCGRGAT
jgi:predicted ABC-type sugar transport system permease subunit